MNISKLKSKIALSNVSYEGTFSKCVLFGDYALKYGEIDQEKLLLNQVMIDALLMQKPDLQIARILEWEVDDEYKNRTKYEKYPLPQGWELQERMPGVPLGETNFLLKQSTFVKNKNELYQKYQGYLAILQKYVEDLCKSQSVQKVHLEKFSDDQFYISQTPGYVGGGALYLTLDCHPGNVNYCSKRGLSSFDYSTEFYDQHPNPKEHTERMAKIFFPELPSLEINNCGDKIILPQRLANQIGAFFVNGRVRKHFDSVMEKYGVKHKTEEIIDKRLSAIKIGGENLIEDFMR